MPAIKVTADATITTAQLARLFSELDSTEMALFFNEVARIAETEWNSKWGLSYMYMDVANHNALTQDARNSLALLSR
jgi:hypothetical protein